MIFRNGHCREFKDEVQLHRNLRGFIVYTHSDHSNVVRSECKAVNFGIKFDLRLCRKKSYGFKNSNDQLN